MSEENTNIKAGSISCEKTRKLKILKSLHKLVHACKCTDLNCEEIGCENMKSLVIHFKVCTKKGKRKQCHLCTQLLSLCIYHARNSKDCEAVHCVVPYCSKIKFKLDLKKGVFPERIQLWEPEPMGASGSSSNSGTSSDLELGQSSRNSESSQNDYVDVPPVDAPSPGLGDEDDQMLDLEVPRANPEISAPPQTQSFIQMPVPPLPPGGVFRIDQSHNLQNEILLKKLLHSQNCLSEEERGVARWPCFETDCGVMKNVIRHISQCHLERECTRIHCASAKFLLNHWRHCNNRECSLCRPIRVSHMASSETNSFGFINRCVPDWKDELSHVGRNEIVEYGVAVLIARWTYQTNGMLIFMKKVEKHAFCTCSSRFEYCKFIAGKLPYFIEFDVRLRQGYEIPEEEIVRLFEGVLSPNFPHRQREITYFMRRHPQFAEAFSKRRTSLNRNINMHQFQWTV